MHYSNIRFKIIIFIFTITSFVVSANVSNAKILYAKESVTLFDEPTWIGKIVKEIPSGTMLRKLGGEGRKLGLCYCNSA